MTLRLSTDVGSIQRIPTGSVPGGIERGPLQQVALLGDGTVVQLRPVRGNLAAYRELLADSDAVRSFSVTGDREGHVFAHYEPTPAARSLLEWCRAHPILVQEPFEFDRDGVVLTLVGRDEGFSAAMEGLPPSVAYEVRETGQFSPGWLRPFRGLTDRQREILATAVERGYYENPRQATQADVARELSLAPGTVGDHLRTIESRVFSQATAALGRH